MQGDSKDFFLDISAIIARFSDVFGCRTDADAAKVLGLSRQAVANWRAAGKGNLDAIVKACATHGKSLDYVLTGHASATPPTIEQALRVITDAGYSVRKGE